MKIKNLFLTAKLTLIVLTFLLVGSCSKSNVELPNEETALLTKSASMRVQPLSTPEFGTLAQAWVKWIVTFPVDNNPFTDETGALQGTNQPYDEGIYFLGGSTGPGFNRTVSIPAQYTQVFVPLANVWTWYAECDPENYPANGESGEEWLGFISMWVKHPVTLKVKLNKQNMIKSNFDQYRGLTEAFVTNTHYSWANGRGTCGADNQNFNPTYLADGYWLLLSIPDSNSTLEIEGGINFNQHGGKSGIFRNGVTYNIIR